MQRNAIANSINLSLHFHFISLTYVRLEFLPTEGCDRVAMRFNKPKELKIEPLKSGSSASRGIGVKTIRLYLRRNRQVSTPGFGSITLDINGFTAMVSNMSILRDDDGTFHVRLPFTDSPDKRVGAVWGQCDECNSRYIVPPSDADLTDLTKPWVSRWPTIGGDLGDACSRAVSGLVQKCNVCSNMRPHDSDLLADLQTIRQDLINDPETDPHDVEEVDREIGRTLEVCGTYKKSVVLSIEGTVECSGFYPSFDRMSNSFGNTITELENHYDSVNDDGADIPM